MKAITDRQREALFAIHQVPSASLSDIGAVLHISVRGAHDHVIALERKGLITRRRAGRTAVERGIALTTAGYAAIGINVPADRTVRLVGLLVRCLEALRSYDSRAPLLADITKEIS